MPLTSRRCGKHGFTVAALVCLLLLGVTSVSAQGSPPPITIGENQIGAVSDAGSSVSYSLMVAAPQSVEIQVLAITPGFAPTFVVLDPAGSVVLDAANPGTQTIARGTPNLYSLGAYTIEVSSANNAGGQFLISIQAGAPLALPLALGEESARSDCGCEQQCAVRVARRRAAKCRNPGAGDHARLRASLCRA